jgi:hypothetical protein
MTILDLDGRQARLAGALEALWPAWGEEEAGSPRPRAVADRLWRAYVAAWRGLDAETALDTYRAVRRAWEDRPGHACVHSGIHVAVCDCERHRYEP